MDFEVIEQDQIPARNASRLSPYSAVKGAFASLPIGKALKVPQNGKTTAQIKNNVYNWAAQIGCRVRTATDRENKCIYIWKVEEPLDRE